MNTNKIDEQCRELQRRINKCKTGFKRMRKTATECEKIHASNRIKELAAEQMQEQSLLSRIEAGDKAGVQDWNKRAAAGEHMLIM